MGYPGVNRLNKGDGALRVGTLLLGAIVLVTALAQRPALAQTAPSSSPVWPAAPGRQMPEPSRPVLSPPVAPDPEKSGLTPGSGPFPAVPGPAMSAGVVTGGSPSSCPTRAVPSAEPDKRKTSLEAAWDNGLVFESENDDFRLHVGGLGQIDTVWLVGPRSVFAAPGGGISGVGNSSATFVRRAILQADGDIYNQFNYFLQIDFANASNDNSGLQPPSFGNLTSSPALLNVWTQIRDVPYLGNVRIGHQKKPIGMENQTPSAFLPFMERSDAYDAFYGAFDNGFALGITARNWDESERLTWQYGIYRPATEVFGVALKKYAIGGRVTALPEYEEDGAEMTHVGLGLWSGELVEGELRVRVRPVLRNAPGFAVPVLADTGEILRKPTTHRCPRVRAGTRPFHLSGGVGRAVLDRRYRCERPTAGDRLLPRRLCAGPVLPDRRA